MSMFIFRRLFSESNAVLSTLFSLTVISFLVFTATASFAGASRHAVQAQQMLGEGLWSQVIHVENNSPSRAYPATVYATVFEFDRALWIYTEMGTQRLSGGRRVLDRDRENLLPLLQNINRGFESYTLVSPKDQQVAEISSSFPKLTNGCLIESIWAFQKRSKEEAAIESAEVLCYSSFSMDEGVEVNERGDPDGHCVLVYRTDTGYFFVDPSDLSVVGTFRDDLDWKPVTVAEEIELAYGDAVVERAFFVPFGR